MAENLRDTLRAALEACRACSTRLEACEKLEESLEALGETPAEALDWGAGLLYAAYSRLLEHAAREAEKAGCNEAAHALRALARILAIEAVFEKPS